MKKILIGLILVSSLAVHGQESGDDDGSGGENPTVTTQAPGTKRKSKSSINLGLSFLQWNEEMTLQQSGSIAKDTANFSGMAFSAEKEVTYYRWGWSISAMLGSGKANAGGNSVSIPYQQTKQAWTVLGATPRVFYRLTGRINFGFAAPVFMKQIDWPESTGLTVDSGRKTVTGGLLDLKIRLTNKVDFYQAFGPLSQNNSTLWQMGLVYRL